MRPSALRQKDDQEQDGGRQHDGCQRLAEGKSAMIERLVEKIADRSAERARQD